MADKKPKYQTLPGVIVNAKSKKKAPNKITTDWAMKPTQEVSESTSPLSTKIKQKEEVKQQTRLKNNDGLREISRKEFDDIPERDTRPFDSNSRAKERGDALWNTTKKVTAIGQFSPEPISRYSSIALNSLMGAADTYFSLEDGDLTNAKINAIGAIPLPGYGSIQALRSMPGLSKRQKLSILRSALSTLGVDVFGTAADLTDNFGLEQKQNGGWLNRYQPAPEYKLLPEVVIQAKTKPKGERNTNAAWSFMDPIVMTPRTDMVGMGVPNFKQFIETSGKIKAQQEKDLKSSMLESSRRAAQTTVSPVRSQSFFEKQEAEKTRRQRNKEIAAANPDKYKYDYDTGDLIIKELATPGEWSNASYVSDAPDFVKTLAQYTPSGRDYDAGAAFAHFYANTFPYLAPITATGRLTSELVGNDEYGINLNKGVTVDNVLGGAMMGIDAATSVIGLNPGIKVLTKPIVDDVMSIGTDAKKLLKEYTPPSYPFGRNLQKGKDWMQYIASPEVQNRFNFTLDQASDWLEDLMVKKTGKTIPEIDAELVKNPRAALRYERIVHDELFGNTGGGRYHGINAKIDDISSKIKDISTKFKTWGDYLNNTSPVKGAKDLFDRIDQAAGKAIGFKPGNIESVVEEANRLLSEGLGVKKGDVDISLELTTPFKGYHTLYVKVKDPNLGWVKLGYIDLRSNVEFSPATLSGKIKQLLGRPITKPINPNTEVGFIKEMDFPNEFQGNLTRQGAAYDYTTSAIGAETHQALKKAIEKHDASLLSSTGHTEGTRTSGFRNPGSNPGGEVRYLREYLNGRLQGVSSEGKYNQGWEQRVKDYMKKSGKTKWTTHEVELLLDQDPSLAPKGIRFKYEDGGSVEASQGGYTDIPFNYNSAWGGQFQNGGNLPVASSSSVKRNTLSKISTDGKNDFTNYATIINSYPDIANDTSYIMTKMGPAGEEQFFYNTNRGKPVVNYNKGRNVVPVSNSISDDLRKEILAGVGGFQDGGNVYPVNYVPQAQNGTYVQPTTADSLNLYNSQMALNKFYENEMKQGRLKKAGVKKASNFIPTDVLNDLNLDWYRQAIGFRKRYIDKYGEDDEDESLHYDREYKKFFNLTPKQIKELELKGLAKTKSGNKYQAYYRDLITGLQNLASPFAMVDSRIRPQRTISYESMGSYPGGNVTVYDYDPLSIKPYNLRTPKEKIEWEKKYKDKTSTPNKPQPKPEPTLKGKVSKVEKLPMGKPPKGPGIKEREMPNIQSSSKIDMGKYKVDYFDPSEGTDVQGGWHTRSFRSEKEASDFMKQRSAENKFYGPSMTQRVEYQMGGSIPGSVGFTYARTNSPAPSEGPYAKKTMPSAQEGKIIPIDPKKDPTYSQPISEAMKFTIDWMNSPMYKKMLEESTGEREYNLIDAKRRAAIEDGKINYYQQSTDPTTGAGTFISRKGEAEMYLNPDAKYPNWSDNITHELSHITDFGGRYIPLKDRQLMAKYATHNIKDSPLYETAKQQGNVGELRGFTNYVNIPTETRARINNLRKGMLEQGVYDPFTQSFSKDMLDKYKQMELNEQDKKEGRTIGMDPYQQLKLSYTDEEIEDMMNKISKTSNDKTLTLAQNGASMSYYQNGLDWKPKGMKNGGKSSDTNYKFGKSKIQGVGTFAKNTIQPGEYIGKVHTINELGSDYDFTDLGRNHNHSESPNVQNVLIGNERHLVAIKPIAKGQELTSNYRLQQDLEQPEDFGKKNNKKKNGGWLNQYK